MTELSHKRIKYILLRDSIVLLVGALYAIFIRCTGFAFPCIFRLVTGLKCPGCGISRACIALLQRNVAEAFSYNPFLFIAAPVIAYLIVKTDIGYIKNGNYLLNKIDTIISYVLIALAVIFAVLRNIF